MVKIRPREVKPVQHEVGDEGFRDMGGVPRQWEGKTLEGCEKHARASWLVLWGLLHIALATIPCESCT